MTEQTNQMEHVKVLIIGSGPAGYTTASIRVVLLSSRCSTVAR